MRYEWRFHASPRPGRHCVIVAIGAACLLLACTTVRAQPAGSNPTAPEQPDQKTAPTTEDKPAEAADFPGAGLFNSHPLFLVGVKVSHSDLRYKEGDLLSATFTAEKEAFLYLLYHQADGQSLLLYPNPAARDHRLPAQESVTIPTPGGNFRFRVQPPLGQEVFQVLATTAPAPELDDLVQDGSQGALVTAEVIERLRARLAQDLSSWTEHRVRIETVAGAVTQAARPARRVSLLIGVDDYEDPKLCEPGARFRTGAELMRDALTQRGGVSPQDTKILLGKDATRAGIEEALVRWLPSVSAPGDTVFIFYTGHGVTIPSDDPDKPGGRDGLLSTYDNKVPGPVESVAQLEGQLRDKQISDEALARWLQELPGRQIVLMLETCHAASMLDQRVLTRFFAAKAATVKGLSQTNMLVMAACTPEEVGHSAPDKPVLMAYYLAEAMQQAFEHFREGQRKFLREVGRQGYQEPLLIDTTLLPIMLVP
jgi:hypothetical protein